MSFFSLHARKQVFEIGIAFTVCWAVVAMQLAVLNRFSVNNVCCNLPLTFIIVWGAVFGSRFRHIAAGELRTANFFVVFLRQAASGSLSGLLVGAVVSALYQSELQFFAICYPLAGWIAGYFCLRNVNKENLLCLPLVLVLTGAAELIMCWQLQLSGHAGAFEELKYFVLPEAFLNAIIAPFIYLPMRAWYDLHLTIDSSWKAD